MRFVLPGTTALETDRTLMLHLLDVTDTLQWHLRLDEHEGGSSRHPQPPPHETNNATAKHRAASVITGEASHKSCLFMNDAAEPDGVPKQWQRTETFISRT